MLNFDQSRKYTKLLLDADLLQWDSASKEYRATEKAIGYLREFDDFQRLRKEVDQRAKHLDDLLRPKDSSRVGEESVPLHA